MVRLATVAGRIGRGEWDATIDVHGRDEVGALADSFRTMVGELRQTTVSKTYVDDIVQSMADSLVVIDINGKILMANRATHALLDYDEGSLVGEPIQRITVVGGSRFRAPGRLPCEGTHTRLNVSTSPVTDGGSPCWSRRRRCDRKATT